MTFTWSSMHSKEGTGCPNNRTKGVTQHLIFHTGITHDHNPLGLVQDLKHKVSDLWHAWDLTQARGLDCKDLRPAWDDNDSVPPLVAAVVHLSPHVLAGFSPETEVDAQLKLTATVSSAVLPSAVLPCMICFPTPQNYIRLHWNKTACLRCLVDSNEKHNRLFFYWRW